ncbi:MAG: iron-containing alcohol dehydrogenase [Candidatus Melainabacteria bacterium]|nr:iron-containing alcohol dehydrogenase [Candidatus Melainabacteria bacterium]
MPTTEEVTLPLIDPTIKGQILDNGVIGFSFAPQIIFGYGALNRIGFLSLFLKAKNVLIVTDTEIEKLGFVTKAQKYLEKSGIKSHVFNEIEPNPKEETVLKGVEKFKSTSADTVIAIGGGSVIDASKIIRLIVKQGGKPSNYSATKSTIMSVHETLPHQISVPTTSGTGSEVSIVAMVTSGNGENGEKEKITILGYPLISTIALIDPQLTMSCPPKLTAHCGMDALTHAIEAFVSLRVNPVADIFSLQATALIFQNLRKAYLTGQDVIARINMSLASMIAGMAFNQKSVGLVHACSHQLSAICNLPHGLANAIMLPHILRLNKKVSSSKYSIMAAGFGINDDEDGKKFISEIEKLNKDLGIPLKLSECRVKESDIGVMVPMALKDISGITNPLQPITKEMVEEVYRAAL